MRRPLIQRPKPGAAVRLRERGVTLALVAVSISSLVAMAALSIDLGTLYEARSEAQRSANAAALAGARFLSTSGLTGDPSNASATWTATCANATQVAQAVANQTSVGGSAPSGVTVSYSADSASSSAGVTDCSTLGSGFAVNALVTVKVAQTNLATYFSRIWGRTGRSVSASATAEAFNPSASENYSSSGNVVPVQPRCVKPWFVPNIDPGGGTCTPGTCSKFVNLADGSIVSPGIQASGSGVIGEQFWLVADCRFNGATCVFRTSPTTPPQANAASSMHKKPPPNLEYLPGLTSFASAAVPSDGSDACGAVTNPYAKAIAGCDQSTQYQCGKPVSSANLDLTENPAAADTTNGVECLIHQGNGNGLGQGQDTLPLEAVNTASYPFQIQAGANNPLLNSGASNNDIVTSSSSIASLPIYDSTTTVNQSGPYNVTVVGFLQVFINQVDNFGNVSVTVMNVAGCGNAASGTPLVGTSPVPVRLVTPP